MPTPASPAGAGPGRLWLKPFGTSRPRRWLPDRWTDRLPLTDFPLMTGPARASSPPPLSRGDLVLCHAVGHVRLFAAVELASDPVFDPEGPWAPRWPWLMRATVTTWVPRISDGPHTTAILPRRVIGQIQRGSLQVLLNSEEFADALGALQHRPSARSVGIQP